MSTITIWLLIAVSGGGSNGSAAGVVTVVERFATRQDCFNVRAPLEREHQNARFTCIEAKGLKP
jgi:hypothetical protein